MCCDPTALEELSQHGELTSLPGLCLPAVPRACDLWRRAVCVPGLLPLCSLLSVTKECGCRNSPREKQQQKKLRGFRLPRTAGTAFLI
ncbi:hypothetical protein NDU88_000234 [Pleurodeles waltl]|uniref:Uncharacterized protein n=1 Tax=Pleurodeles waltl TaxID=8319 RepID=A0AAV7P944_PLEWA|nr:hypothetical protein NDU88_000234 [Pleurodeles waltl]